MIVKTNVCAVIMEKYQNFPPRSLESIDMESYEIDEKISYKKKYSWRAVLARLPYVQCVFIGTSHSLLCVYVCRQCSDKNWHKWQRRYSTFLPQDYTFRCSTAAMYDHLKGTVQRENSRAKWKLTFTRIIYRIILHARKTRSHLHGNNRYRPVFAPSSSPVLMYKYKWIESLLHFEHAFGRTDRNTRGVIKN